MRDSMRVYHFMEKQWAIESLIYERLKVSLFADMNDPFELLGASLKNKGDRTAFEKLKKEVSEELGAICFSEEWTNPVQWSHYGDRHRGIVLGFDIPKDHGHKVNYEGDRIQESIVSGFSASEQDLGRKLLTTKYKHWSYEEEVRMLINLDNTSLSSGMHFLPYCKALAIKEVIIGPRCDITKRHIQKICSDKNIKITKARLAFGSFRVIRNQRVN